MAGVAKRFVGRFSNDELLDRPRFAPAKRTWQVLGGPILLASVVEFCPEAWDEQELSFIEVVSLLQSG